MKVSIQEFGATALQILQQGSLKDPAFMLKFKQCVGDVSRFQFAERTLKAWSDACPVVIFEGKDAAMSEKVRKFGNELFAAGDLGGALVAYNKALCLAPWPTSSLTTQNYDDGDDETDVCLALTLANRSAVLLQEKRYAEALGDLDQAMLLGYPKKNARKLILRKGRVFMALGRFSGAVHCLRKEGLILGACTKEDLMLSDHPSEEMKCYLQMLKEAEEKLSKMDSQPRQGSQKPSPKPKYPGLTEIRVEREKLELAYGPHSIFPSMSAGAAFKHSPETGRFFVAEREFKAGEVILMEPAFVNVLVPSCLASNCWRCLVWTDTPFPCKTCSAVVFCSSTCANDENTKLHALECAFWKTLHGRDDVVSPALVMAMRTVLTKTPEEWRQFSTRSPGDAKGEADHFPGIPHDTYSPRDYDNVFCLVKNAAKHMPAFVLLNALYAVYVVKLLDECYFPRFCGTNNNNNNNNRDRLDRRLRDYIGGIVLRHCLNYTNCDFVAREIVVPWLGDEERFWSRTAHAIHPTFGLLNNACDPNLLAVHYGDVIVARAARPIEKGEILSYPMLQTYLDAPFEKRRNLLKATGLYECSCRPCRERWPVLGVLLEKAAQGLTSFQCPSCKRILGKKSEALEILSSRSTCPQCGTRSADIRPLILDTLRAPKKYNALFDTLTASDGCGGEGDGGEISAAEKFLRDLARAVDSASSVTIPPAGPLCQLLDVMFRACMYAGNKRYDDLDQTAQISLEIAKIRGLSCVESFGERENSGLPKVALDDDCVLC